MQKIHLAAKFIRYKTLNQFIVVTTDCDGHIKINRDMNNVLLNSVLSKTLRAFIKCTLSFSVGIYGKKLKLNATCVMNKLLFYQLC